MNNDLFPVVILAGGLATRLRPLTETLPKSLVEINGEPFIAHQLRLLKKNSVQQVVMCLGFLGDMIIDYVGNGAKFGLDVSYSFDGPQLLGTAGAIRQALSLLEETFFVLNGDSYLPCNYRAVQIAFKQQKKMSLMTVFHNQGQWDKSNVEFDNGSILIYDKTIQKKQMQYIDYGLSIFNKNVFTHLPNDVSTDLVGIYQDLLKQQQLAAFEVQQRFYEIGSFSGIKELELYFFNLAQVKGVEA